MLPQGQFEAMNFEQLHCTRVVKQHRRLEMRRGLGLEALSGMGEEAKLEVVM